MKKFTCTRAIRAVELPESTSTWLNFDHVDEEESEVSALMPSDEQRSTADMPCSQGTVSISGPRVISVPVVSSGHLTLETNERLRRGDFSWCGSAVYQFGSWLGVPAEDVVESKAAFASPDLLALWDWARDAGYHCVQVDANGDRVTTLPFFG